ncbi:MAG TPA: M3 family oligoendopeptidase [Fimbriimonadaceae bacterium]|nr:M3 family oligoendopeptidase [Fimbriimonadaceae bacterium]
MSSGTELSTPAVRWDLAALFESPDDPNIDAGWEEAARRAEVFETTYRGKIDDAGLTASTLLAAIQEMETLSVMMDKPLIFAHLLFAADTANPRLGAFLQSQMEKSSELRVKLLFFELELQKAPEVTIQRLVDDPSLANYRHFIQVARAASPYRLSESEEVILEETANTGIRAWIRLFDEITANQTYRLQLPGRDEPEELSQEQVLAHLYQPDRDTRIAACDAFSEGLLDMQRTIVFVYNNLLLDKKVDDRLRKHPYPEHSRHLSNELDKETVDLVVDMCRKHQGLVARYYRVKREILGLDELTHADRYAPLFEAEAQVDWDEAQGMILESFSSFSEDIGRRAQEFFDQNWIDAEARPGKSGGAFCSYLTPDLHPVILMSYLNRMKDVGTLAHELGHGVHASLSRKQTYFNFYGTLPLAELASIFGEQLVFERLVAEADVRDQLALYADKIEGIFASVFRQAAMFRFEQAAHQKRREEGELAAEDFNEIWQSELQSMFGDSVTMGDQHAWWWMYVSHFFHSPFYVYAYSFGELLTIALYEKARFEGPSFSEKYVRLLALGGSRSPQELMATVGVDLHSEDFWKGGFEVIESLIAKFEELWRTHQAQA